jgi:type VII secretion protein EccB
VATKKDLVEAYSFSRRRLVTAFVSGAPGGREVEPARPGRSIVGGVALAVLLVAGAAIASVFTTSVDPAWAEESGLVISKEEAEVFVITDSSSDPVLHPILNITSAKLILGSDVSPQVIPEDYIAEETIGTDLGIFGAPYDVPDESRLIGSGWTACTDGRSGGLRLALSATPDAAPAGPDGGLLVTVDGELWLVATSGPDADGVVGAHRYRVPDARSTSQGLVLEGLGLGQGVEAPEVGREWLNLLPEGGDVDPSVFGVDPRPANGGEPAPGDVFQVNGQPYLTLADGSQVRLDPFALAVATGGNPGAEYAGDTDDLDLDPDPGQVGFLDARWPVDTLQPVFGERCVQLVAEPGEAPRAQLVQDPQGEAAAAGTGGQSVVVDPGAGAYIRSGGWGETSGGSPFVVDAKGYAYPLVGAEAAVQLGYAGTDAPVVPESWVELFEAGVALSQEAALCAPQAGGEGCG